MRVRHVLRQVRRVSTTAFALVGLGATAYITYEYNELKKAEKKAETTEKAVLVLPFDRMQLRETKKRSFSFDRSWFSSEDDEIVQVEVQELVKVIHAAAQDPNIVALYGNFGEGGFSSGGWAHIEEIRNALKVWRESHRIHLNPNLSHDKVLVRRSNGSPKPSFAYADTFSSPNEKGNKDYIVACAFSHVHMQKNGELQLFGVSASNPFFRSFMEKYGIKAHVFKHGKYKNAPNLFTETEYTREHRQNVQSLVDQFDKNERDIIVNDRNFKGYDPMVWNMIRKHGTFTGLQSKKLGLVDYLPVLDPLNDLLESNKDDESKTAIKGKWGNGTDVERFQAVKKISFADYKSVLAKREKMKSRKWKINSGLKKLAEGSTAFESLLAVLGYPAPYYNINQEEFSAAKQKEEKIAVVHVEGSINESLARKTVSSLRKIKDDPKVKAVVLRIESPGGSVVSSERILQQCKDLPQPVVCSMANVCASGGYYIATGCSRIFALPTTVTGSIGVFAVKFDFSGLGEKYGISVDHITTGPHAATYNAFHPLNKLVKRNLSQNVDRTYEHFKSLVAESRGLDMSEVESLAQGRVWTGFEAKENGLVDELGGLERAIAFVQRNYTEGEADVERWPKTENTLEQVKKLIKSTKGDMLASFKLIGDMFQTDVKNLGKPSVMNEYDSTKYLVQTILENPKSAQILYSANVLLTMDESTALSQHVVESIKQIQ
eukprot:CAMPEP_0178931330 /NCGR_PEP_ID=MMETSP0786-20121207/21855_1 /TAXON_ID=186022 /ORGANISM="Thalassionema frauenfeldii, Strain CCMP 1798" /LENGTH=716 /DNA_ID=CAMNT_0020608205 /DNA_START=288 /DNA_END=2438 /DNA_ORIENTATION=-